MPWSETTPMHQKTQFIADYLREIYTFSELCERYRISRKTGYKWIKRFIEEGPPGLSERRRSPRCIPHRTTQKVIDALLELRQRHPSWGAKKLLVKLQQRRPSWTLPARSTVYDLLRPYGVIKKQRRRRSVGHPGKPQRQASAPNDIWCADFKGEFKTRQRSVLLSTDGDRSIQSITCCLPGVALDTALDGAKPVFARIFREFGLPRFIRSDNGSPFAANSLARLSSLSAWWIQLGVLPDLIEPGKPQQNGRHERMHRTLKDETTRPAANTFSRSAAQVQRVRQGVQPGSSARSARHAHTGLTVRAIGASDARQNSTVRVSRSLRSALCQRQRRHPLEPSLGQRFTDLSWSIRRSRRDRSSTVGCSLRTHQTRSLSRAVDAD